MKKPRLISLFCGRFPGEKAAAIFADQEAASFSSIGYETTLIAPRRLGRGTLTSKPYRTVYLPTIDLSLVPVLWCAANIVNVLIYSKLALLWILFTGNRNSVIMSNESLPLLCATFVCPNTMYVMHDFSGHPWVAKLLFRRVRWILATNQWKATELESRFGVSHEKIIIERNAVDTDVFSSVSKTDARRELGLDDRGRLIAYTGHLYEWKGADTLAKAAQQLPDMTFVFVGGTEADVQRFKRTH